jgi:hypothetical protein
MPFSSRFFFAQPNLFDRHSHYYGEALGWKSVCAARGIAARFYIHAKAGPGIVQELDACPLFPYQTDSQLDHDPLSQSLADFVKGSESFATCYEQFERDGIGSDDAVIVTYSSERDLYGAARWLARCPPDRRPTFVFIFHVPDFSWTLDAAGENLSGDFSRWRFAMRELKAVLPSEKALLLATSATLANALTGLLEHPCEIGCSPKFYIDDTVLDPIAANLPRVHLRMAGEFRPERGADLVTVVIRRVAMQRPGTIFALQVPDEAVARHVGQELAAIAAQGSHCYVDYGNAAHADYQARLKQSDVVFMPYQAHRYMFRASGVFAEATAFGIVTVVPDRTWMAEQLAAGLGAGTVFHDWSVDAITNACLGALAQHPSLVQRAHSGRAEWRRRNSTATMLEKILARLPK